MIIYCGLSVVRQCALTVSLFRENDVWLLTRKAEAKHSTLKGEMSSLQRDLDATRRQVCPFFIPVLVACLLVLAGFVSRLRAVVARALHTGRIRPQAAGGPDARPRYATATNGSGVAPHHIALIPRPQSFPASYSLCNIAGWQGHPGARDAGQAAGGVQVAPGTRDR